MHIRWSEYRKVRKNQRTRLSEQTNAQLGDETPVAMQTDLAYAIVDYFLQITGALNN